MARKPTPSSKDQGQLSIQIDTCADSIAELIAETRKKMNDAMAAGDLDAADRFDEIALEQTVQYATLVRHQIKKIDDSAELRDAIKGFAGVSTSINDLIKQNKAFAEFLTTAATISSLLEKLVGIALVAA